MNTVTFETLPSAVSMLLDKVEKIESSLAAMSQPSAESADRWMNIQELMEYHPDKPAKKTVYDWVTLRKIPYHKDGKRLRFLKSEIDRWLMSAYHKTEDELYEESVRFVNSKRERRG
jgi:excisionase family DNA binding protein